jgi:hypothetical protein
LVSIRHRLGWLAGGRVILVLPWDMDFLARALDFDLLRREAERRQLEIAIVTADPERRQLARRCGFSAFASVVDARATEVWNGHSSERVEPPPHHWWQPDVTLRPPSVRPHARWVDWLKLMARIGVFLLALLVLVATAYAIVPSGVVTLVPAGREFVTIVPVSVDPDVEKVDHAARVIPARRVGVEVEGYAEVETTGTMSVAAGQAVGEVLFTNMLIQDYVVPKGTVVRTSSSSYPIRFRTTADVAVPAGGRAAVPVEALVDGVGNVGAFQINQVEGVAASAVRVINPEPTSGADPKDVHVVTQADYDRVRSQLMRQLLDQAYFEMGDLLQSTEVLFRQSLLIVGVPKEAYTRFVSEQADTVGLNMRIQVRGLAVDVGNAQAVGYTYLSRRLPSGYTLVDARFELGEVAEEDIGPGWFTFFVTARGYAAAALDTGAAVTLVQGKAVAEAREQLLDQFPLAEEPRITTWPEELKRMPWLPLRIKVRVVPKDHAANRVSSIP